MKDSCVYTDKNGQEIIIRKDEYDNYEALHDDKIVGRLSIKVCKYDNEKSPVIENAYVENIYVDEIYRRAGIATEMIKYAKNFYDKTIFALDTGAGAKSSDIYYDSDGLALKYICEKLDITDISNEDEW